jgi:hypothetical protein
MIVCPSCEHRNPEDRHHCEECGASLEHFVYRACPECGALNQPNDPYCRRCLADMTSLIAAQAGDEGESSETEAAPPPISQEAVAEPPDEKETAPADETPDLAEAHRADEAFWAAAAEPEPARPEPSVEREGVFEDAFEDLEGPLEGLEEMLPVEPAMAGAHRAAPMDIEPPTRGDREDATLFHDIALGPAPLHEPMQIIIPRRAALLPKAVRVVLYLLLLLAAIVPLITGGTSPWIGLDATTEAVTIANELPGGSVALISFDYGASYAGEMNPIVQAVVQDLARRGVRVVAMSTRAAGNALAERIFRAVTDELPEYTYGDDYVILGYLPGQEAGLRALGQGLRNAYIVDHVRRVPLDELPLMAEVTTVADFDRVLLLADDGQTVRQWIEQVHSRSPMMVDVLTTTRIQPLLIPYRQSGQLHSLMAAGNMHMAPAASDGYAALILVMAITSLAANFFIRDGRRD